MIEIKTISGKVLYTAQTATDVRTALIEAAARGAYLRGADLRWAPRRHPRLPVLPMGDGRVLHRGPEEAGMTDYALDTRGMTVTVAPKKLPSLYAGIVGAAMLTMTTVGVTPPPAPSMEFAQVWTTGVTGAARPDTANAVRSLKKRSGLSWQQLADAFGVSRRSLHFWANGGNMAAASVQRLEALKKAVGGLGQLDTAAARAALLAPRAGGRSKLDDLVREVTPRRVSARTSVDAQLNAVQDDTKHPGSVRSSKTLPVKLAEFTAKDIAAIPHGSGGKSRVFRCKVVGEKNLLELGLVDEPVEVLA